MANSTPKNSLFPLQALERFVKQRESCLLGLCGVLTPDERITGAASSLHPASPSTWQNILNQFVESIAERWDRTPTLIRHDDLPQLRNTHPNTRNRYGSAESITKWKAMPLCLLDFGFDNADQIRKWGRQCDGVAMIVLGELKFAKKRISQLRDDAIPWIGYWTIAYTSINVEISEEKHARIAA